MKLILSVLGLALLGPALAQPALGEPSGAVSGSSAGTASATIEGAAGGTGARAGRARRFSKPLWLPLRDEAKVHCVRRNCRQGGAARHGYWAIDFLARTHGQRHRKPGVPADPVYSAGYGIAHVGSRGNTCLGPRRPSRPIVKRGNWVWVDHGRGQKTLYFHLARISVRNGQRVTPNTRLGTMGSTGKCGVTYLHYERRRGRLDGDPSPALYPLAGLACHGAKLVKYPRVLGRKTWDGTYDDIVWSDGTACRRR